MTVSADTLRRLAALKLPGEAFQEVLSIIADMQATDDARRERQRHRKRKSRDGHRESHGTVTAQGRDQVSPHPLSKKEPEAKKPQADEASSSRLDLEREFFNRGKQVLGKNAGGLLSSLLKAKGQDIALARAALEVAATKQDPREYAAAACNPHNGNGKGHGTHRQGSLAAAADDLIERARTLERAAGIGEPASPFGGPGRGKTIDGTVVKSQAG